MSLPEIYWATWRALFLLPLLVILVLWAFGRRRTRQPLSDSSKIVRRWITQGGLSEHPPRLRRAWRGVLFGIGLLLAGLGLARPQWGEIQEQSFEQQREILVALDLSQSMLAEDVSPSRLARSKLLVEGLLEALRGERVGLALFAGTSFLQSPLSADHEVMRDLLTDLDPSYLPQGGTNYKALLDTALGAFSDGEADRFLVILSDGEAHDQDWKKQIPELTQRGIRVVSLGVGTADGGVVPDATGGYLKDARGAVVLSRLTPATLEALARRTGGVYENAAVWVDIAGLIEKTVARGTKGAFSEQKAPRLVERFQLFLGSALLFLLLGYLFELPVPPHARKLGAAEESATRQKFFETPALVLLALLLSSAVAHAATPPMPEKLKTAEPPALVKIIGALSEKPRPEAKDYASMAEETLRFASKPTPDSTPTLRSVVDDALAAVDHGESLDPKAASWKDLRDQLMALRDRLDHAAQDKPQPSSSSPTEQDKKKQQQGQQGEPDENKSEGQGSSVKPNEKQGESEQSSSQAPGAEPKPLDENKAGLGSLDEKQDQEQEKGSAQQPEKSAHGSRVVGGGAGREQELNKQHPELSEALGKMQSVVDRDSPATLYQRMRGERNSSPKRAEGKNW